MVAGFTGQPPKTINTQTSIIKSLKQFWRRRPWLSRTLILGSVLVITASIIWSPLILSVASDIEHCVRNPNLCIRLYKLDDSDFDEKNTQEKTIFGTTYRLTNASGNDYFVPTKTEREWNAFKAHLPRGVSLCERDIALLATENDGIPGCTKVWECNGSTFSDVTATTTEIWRNFCAETPESSAKFYTHPSRISGFNWWTNNRTCHDGVPANSRCIPVSYSWEYDERYTSWSACSKPVVVARELE